MKRIWEWNYFESVEYLSFLRTGGYYRSGGNVNYRTTGGYWWSATSGSAAIGRYLFTYPTFVDPQYGSYRGYGFAIRCVVREGWKERRAPNSSSGSTQLRSAPLRFEYTGYYGYSSGLLSDAGLVGFYWSRSAASTDSAYYLHLDSSDSNWRGSIIRDYGLAVRCVGQQIPIRMNVTEPSLWVYLICNYQLVYFICSLVAARLKHKICAISTEILARYVIFNIETLIIIFLSS